MTKKSKKLIDKESLEIPSEYETKDYLSIHVKKINGTYKGYIESGLSNLFFEVNVEEKINYEIQRWMSVLTTALEFSQNGISKYTLEPKEIHDPFDKPGNARTYRMLFVLNSVLLSHSKAKETIGIVSELPDSNWYVSLGLIMITAVAYSQCQWHRPVLWEAYSAGWARDELSKRWNFDDKLLDIVSFLIRYQSDPGQVFRKSGKITYRNNDKRTTPVPNPIFTIDQLERALMSIAPAQEVRNKKLVNPFKLEQALKSISPTQEVRNELLEISYNELSELANVGVEKSKPWDTQSAIDYFEFFFGNHYETSNDEYKFGYTWSYSGFFPKDKKDFMDQFKSFVELEISQLPYKNKVEFERVTTENEFWKDQIARISFGRRQSYELKDTIVKNIISVVESINKISTFDNFFKLEIVEVQNCFGPNSGSEYVIRVLLEDRISVERLIPKLKLSDLRYKRYEQNLFKEMWEASLQLFKIDTGHFKIEDSYFPINLIERLLEVNYRIRPEESLTIQIRINESQEEFLRIPKHCDSEYSEFVARYICGKVLNKAMTTGFEHCELVTEELDYEWKDIIEKTYNKGGYKTLITTLKNHQTAIKNVNLNGKICSSTIPPISIADVDCILGKMVARNKATRFLGIDIGGSSIKIQCFKYSIEGIFETINDKILRIKTSLPDKAKRYQDSNEFVIRIIEIIKSYYGESINDIESVGITWPGLVRNNRVVGTSKILSKFKGFSGWQGEDSISDILDFDIVNAFQNGWQEKVGKSEIVVSLVNDGNAHATAFAYLMLKEDKNNSSDTFAVIIVGTGTAGGIFYKAIPLDGLFETGKMILNVDTTLDKSFPNGTIRDYCCTETMPKLAKKLTEAVGKKLPEDIQSYEIGYLLDIDIGNPQKTHKILNKLRTRCGCYQSESQDEAQLETKYTEKELGIVEKYEIDKLGEIRLMKLLNLENQDELDSLIEVLKNETWIPEKHTNFITKLKDALVWVRKSVEIIGVYIGDIASIFFNQFDMKNIVIGGGVLSGITGELVSNIANERIRSYHPLMESKDFKLEVYNDQKTKNSKKSQESGILGAVILASRLMIFEKQRAGLKTLRQQIQEMSLNQKIKLEYPIIYIEGKKPIDLKKYAIEKEDVIEYLRYIRTELDVTSFQDEIFIRWSDEPMVMEGA